MNFDTNWILCLIIAYSFLEISYSEVRNKRFLSLFNVVSFPNDVCKAGTKNGTCYTQAECTERNGEESGSCASGFGVCCVFTLDCGASTTENTTYFDSNDIKEDSTCNVKICKADPDIIQLRLDFVSFEISGPSTSTETIGKHLNGIVGGATDGTEIDARTQCSEDSFFVTSPGNPTPPVICGKNNGEHVYVDASDSCVGLNFQIGTGTTSRKFSIMISQFKNTFVNLAPSGCTQYFFGSDEGTVKSFNFDGNSHLGEQNQVVCVRREKGKSRICWTPITASVDFKISGKDADEGITGADDNGCGYKSSGKGTQYDCVLIPGASKKDDSAVLPGIFGGSTLATATGASKMGTICSKVQPFGLIFKTDFFENKDETGVEGFRLILTASITNIINGDDADEAEIYKNCMKNSLVLSEVFCLPSDYKKDVPPPIEGPIEVYFKIPVSEISKIDDQRSQISIRWTYKLKWPEPRMLLNMSADWSTGEINVRGDMIDHFWTPDIIIHDLVSFYKPEILNQVAALEIKKWKQLYFKVRSDMTMVCKGMKFTRFPLDEHVCYLKLTSFGYDDRRMVLDGEFSYDDQNQRALPFNVAIQELSEEMTLYVGSKSNYSVYGLEIRLSRCVSPYLLNVYLPTAIFVVMSWVSFLIPTDVVPARIVLLITLCLVIINTFNNVTARIPVASAVTALEIWLLACILLVFGALAEYAFILRQVINLSRQQRRLRLRMQLENPGSSFNHPNYNSPPAVFAPGASLTANSAARENAVGAAGRNGSGGSSNRNNPSNNEEWQMKELVAKQTSHHSHHLHPHHHHQVVHHGVTPTPTVSLETHQTERGANTTIAATTHHLHEIDDTSSGISSLSLTHRSVGICTSNKGLQKNNRANSTSRMNHAKTSSADKDFSQNGAGNNSVSTPVKQTKTHEQLMRRYQEHVDGKALIVFPIAFLLFNIGYWCHYLWPGGL